MSSDATISLALIDTGSVAEAESPCGEVPLSEADCLGWKRSMLLEDGECSANETCRRYRTAAIALALTLQGLFLTSAILGPLAQEDPLPEPRIVKTFITAPVPAVPPPPPSPAVSASPATSPPSETLAPAPSVAVRRIRPPRPFARAATTALTLSEFVPFVAPDFGPAAGVPGGLPGGVVGGVVGGLAQPPPPAPERSADPLRAGLNVHPPRKLYHVDPVYPAIARYSRVTGVVILEATIDPAGRVTGLSVLNSIPLLDEPAIEAVRQWKYEPTLLDGIPVPIVMTVTVQFALTD